MNYKDLELKRSYVSCGDNDIVSGFLVPALKCSKKYKRSVGFFSSSVFETIIDGIVGLARNKGTIQLIASPNLSADDVDAISQGYERREQIVKSSFDYTFAEEIEKLDDMKLQLLIDLISSGILDIKIAISESSGIYHDKLGVLEDLDGNIIAFYGSSNATLSGYKNNYEKIRLSRSWMSGEDEIVIDEVKEFDDLWNSENPHVKVYEYKESAKKQLLQITENRKSKQNFNTIKLRDYQETAISKWVENGCKGFYVMATGTGKTWTAIYSAKELLKKKNAVVVICAPYKHLVKQWAEDVEKAFPTSSIILVSSENPSWEKQISNAIIRNKYDANKQIIIISTIRSFEKERFSNTINKSLDEKLLIVDEAHRFTNRTNILKETYKYMLGLSATPFSGSSAQAGNELMQFFGGQVFSLPIEQALERGFLVKYNYYPIYVAATSDEEEKFQYYSQKIASCFKNNRCINPDLLVKSLRGRLRVIAMAEEKLSNIENILSYINEKDHFVVYCGDGVLFDENTGEEIRHIQSIKRVLTQHDFKTSQFTAQEDMRTRMELVDSFNKGEISSLVAIRCLDEGINIPSIKSALIMASNDDYREFVQRRGRILRTYRDKKIANIYDVVVLPSSNMASWARIELRRYYEYAKLAENWDELEYELNTMLDEYGLTIEDIDVYDYEGMERELDE